jgi:hypothetical protein
MLFLVSQGMSIPRYDKSSTFLCPQMHNVNLILYLVLIWVWYISVFCVLAKDSRVKEHRSRDWLWSWYRPWFWNRYMLQLFQIINSVNLFVHVLIRTILTYLQLWCLVSSSVSFTFFPVKSEQQCIHASMWPFSRLFLLIKLMQYLCNCSYIVILWFIFCASFAVLFIACV